MWSRTFDEVPSLRAHPTELGMCKTHLQHNTKVTTLAFYYKIDCNLLLQCVLDCPDVTAVPKGFPAPGHQHVDNYLGSRSKPYIQYIWYIWWFTPLVLGFVPIGVDLYTKSINTTAAYPQAEKVWGRAGIVLLVLSVGDLGCHEPHLRQICIVGYDSGQVLIYWLDCLFSQVSLLFQQIQCELCHLRQVPSPDQSQSASLDSPPCCNNLKCLNFLCCVATFQDLGDGASWCFVASSQGE